MLTSSATLIPKESIPSLRFEKKECLPNEADRIDRKMNLEKAVILGNTYKKKVRITFETETGAKIVETTVWAVTERNILLKSGVYLPIGAIIDVDLYTPS